MEASPYDNQDDSDPRLDLNDGNRIPSWASGCSWSPRPRPRRRSDIALDRLPVDRHRRRVRERGRRPRRRADERAGPRRRVHHDQAAQQRPRAPQRAARVRGEPRQARWRLHRPVPDPLASSARRPDRRDVGGIGRAAARGARPLDRRLQLPGGGPRADHRRHRRRARGQPDRASPAPPAARAARFHGSTGSSPRRGARWARPSSSTTPTIERIASAHGRTPAQVVLRWHIQLGNIVIPKSVTPEPDRGELPDLDFELSEEDMHALFELDREERTGPDPATFGVEANRTDADFDVFEYLTTSPAWRPMRKALKIMIVLAVLAVPRQLSPRAQAGPRRSTAATQDEAEEDHAVLRRRRNLARQAEMVELDQDPGRRERQLHGEHLHARLRRRPHPLGRDPVTLSKLKMCPGQGQVNPAFKQADDHYKGTRPKGAPLNVSFRCPPGFPGAY